MELLDSIPYYAKENVASYLSIHTYLINIRKFFVYVLKFASPGIVQAFITCSEIIACNDLRTGDKSLYYAGTSEFEDVYEEFSDVYEIGMNT